MIRTRIGQYYPLEYVKFGTTGYDWGMAWRTNGRDHCRHGYGHGFGDGRGMTPL